MRRWHHKSSFTDRAARVAGFALLAGAGVLLLTQLGSLRRYFNIRRMAGSGHPRPPGTQRRGSEAPPRWGTSHWPTI